MSDNIKKIALILAGGIGLRADESIPKQFIKVGGKPVIIYTLEQFQKCDRIDDIYIVCVDGWIEKLYSYVHEFNISKVKRIVSGGESGLESARNGLNAIDPVNPDDLILIHDSVRPFVEITTIEENISVAEQHGVAVTSVDLVETLVYSKDGIFSDKLIPRDGLKRILTPQTFKYSILRKLYDESELDATMNPSTFSLYMRTGQPVYCSKGTEKNIKLTYHSDIEYFKKMFS